MEEIKKNTFGVSGAHPPKKCDEASLLAFRNGSPSLFLKHF
ncbi:hypothetical protein CDSM653_00103 [Caldanaerobacter subterraneus subsp. pacificus DSM 12653]|uniref:Uncharacterized protein n=1 Tax=Caldanaerobacter subterraneus subsp. pacificus DSM 12653 TaxID=391606 RepID=A0A0F5PQD4_9THEO|nr:hypothetical protein CDSM653_00103 [Caldanaerobacter subterraneus subsp. pacificus DSM 12653]